MNMDRIEQHLQRLMLMAVLCHSYRDWGVVGQIGILTLCLAWAFLTEWTQHRCTPERGGAK